MDGLGQVQVLPEDCLLYICECGVITRKDMKTLRLCSSHLRDVVNRLFFRSAVVVRTTETLTSANPLAKSMVLHHTHICARLTTLTIYGASSWGMLKVTTSQLWVILTTARAVSTVVLASVYISGPPHSQAVLTPRKALMRVSFLDADFATTSTFVQAMVAIGSIEWLHLEHITFSRGIHFGVGSLGADELHCRAWVPTAARVSFCSFSWSTAGIFTSTFTPCDGRAEDVEELDISFHSLANANNAVPLLKACSNLHTLRVHFYSPSRYSVHSDFSVLNKFFDNLRHSTISTLEVFITTSRQSLFPARVIEMAWRSIRAVSPSVTTIRIGISTTCVECFLPSRGDDLGPNWPILIDTLRDRTCGLTVQFGEWGASSQTGLLMADSFATPKGTIIPSSHELKNTLQPCSSLLREALTKGLERVITGACIKIM